MEVEAEENLTLAYFSHLYLNYRNLVLCPTPRHALSNQIGKLLCVAVDFLAQKNASLWFK
eukprot:SAG31_NODE_3749_length_3922_cov_1.586144_4_plen_60_part_00